MKITSKLVLAAAAAASLFAMAPTAQAHHIRFLRFPHLFPPSQPDYAYDNYDDEDYLDEAYADDYADPDYVPRRHKRQRVIQSEVDPWWLDEPAPRRLKKVRALEPVPYSKPRSKRLTSTAPVPKLVPKPVKAKPKLVTASLTPAKPKVTTTKAPVDKTIGCTAGAAIVTGYGFASVTPKVCTGAVYAYSATRDGKPYVIKVTATKGEITEVTKQ